MTDVLDVAFAFSPGDDVPVGRAWALRYSSRVIGVVSDGSPTTIRGGAASESGNPQT